MTLQDLRNRRDEILRVAAAHGASNVRVFGSVARGEAGPESDIDMLVDMPSNLRGLAFFGALDDLRRDLEALLGQKVDVSEAIQGHARASAEHDLVPL
jgi:predicted nucleotidyltransferase